MSLAGLREVEEQGVVGGMAASIIGPDQVRWRLRTLRREEGTHRCLIHEAVGRLDFRLTDNLGLGIVIDLQEGVEVCGNEFFVLLRGGIDLLLGTSPVL